MIDIENDLCPCQSRELVKDCCLRDGGKLVPSECDTKPAGGRTRYANPKCYARALEDCSQTISLEHPVPQEVLRQIDSTGNLGLTGLSWQSEEVTPNPGVARLGNKVLCTRHNSALSPLDVVGIRFFRSLDWSADETRERDGTKRGTIFLFNGHDVERFALKVLAGLVAAGVTGWSPRGTQPPEYWLRILFENQHFAPEEGLYRPPARLSTGGRLRSIGMLPLFEAKRLVGLRFGVNDAECVLAFDPKSQSQGHWFSERHPSGFHLCNGGSREKWFGLHWDEPPGCAVVI